jgi:hypothetical protein
MFAQNALLFSLTSKTSLIDSVPKAQLPLKGIFVQYGIRRAKCVPCAIEFLSSQKDCLIFNLQRIFPLLPPNL